MSKAAIQALRKLLGRAESGWTRDSDSTISLPMTDSSFPAYLDIDSLQAKDQFHVVVRGAERQGALAIEWDPLAGKEGQIKRLVLRDRNKLAEILGVTPLWDAFDRAERALAEHIGTLSIQGLLAAWRSGKRPRSIGPEKVVNVLDALRVMSVLDAHAEEDTPVRKLSAKLFRNSKRIEELLPVLDYLTQDDETYTLARPPEDVMASLGLVKFPQPVLIAGKATVHFNNGDSMNVPTPYLGLAPQSLEAIEVAWDARYILTVENYTPFNEIAKGKAGLIDGVVVYTAGMPSPSFLRFYSLVIDRAAQNIPLYHWGDIDLGGFRIADVLARQAERRGRQLSLWNMNPELMKGVDKWCDLSNSDASWIRSIALKHGWEHELAGIESSNACYEQEMMDVSCPPLV